MKAVLFYIMFIFSSITFSQGNLQFNQVLNFSPGNSYTVPTGKVLKIESISISGSTICMPRTSTISIYCNGISGIKWYTVGIYAGYDFFKIGDYTFSIPQQQVACTDVNTNPDCFNYMITEPPIKTPVWLPAGKTISLNQNNVKILISAIEFNIVQ
jgi:hypothetical protein